MIKYDRRKEESGIPDEMAMHLEKFKLSGLSQIEYCRMNKLSYCKLIYWIRKPNREAAAKLRSE